MYCSCFRFIKTDNLKQKSSKQEPTQIAIKRENTKIQNAQNRVDVVDKDRDERNTTSQQRGRAHSASPIGNTTRLRSTIISYLI